MWCRDDSRDCSFPGASTPGVLYVKKPLHRSNSRPVRGRGDGGVECLDGASSRLDVDAPFAVKEDFGWCIREGGCEECAVRLGLRGDGGDSSRQGTWKALDALRKICGEVSHWRPRRMFPNRRAASGGFRTARVRVGRQGRWCCPRVSCRATLLRRVARRGRASVFRGPLPPVR